MNNIKLGVSQSRGYENVEIKTISSREVATMMEMTHDNLLKKISKHIENFNKIEDVKINVFNYFLETTYKQTGNGKECKEYQVTKRGCEFLAHKTTGVKGDLFTVRYMERFEQMEQVLHNPYAHLSKEFQAIIMHDEKIMKLERRVEQMEENAKLDPAEYSLVSKRVSSRVYEVQKERQMNLNKKQIGELFRALNRDILEITGVKTRTQLRQKHLNMVLDFINDWYPSRAAMFNINQMSLEI